MRTKHALALALGLLPAAAFADDLTGSAQFLCTAWHAARCTADGSCDSSAPWKLNIPDFVRLDLDGKRMTTTASHSEERSTPIEGFRRDEGLIVLHGQQAERAWSWVINEVSGEGTLTISSKGAGVTIFSACTPIESLVSELGTPEGTQR